MCLIAYVKRGYPAASINIVRHLVLPYRAGVTRTGNKATIHYEDCFMLILALLRPRFCYSETCTDASVVAKTNIHSFSCSANTLTSALCGKRSQLGDSFDS